MAKNPQVDTDQKPMVSREDYDRARAVLDALPAGYYVKCGGCSKWFMGGTFVLDASGLGPMCEDCHRAAKPKPAKVWPKDIDQYGNVL